MNIKRLSDFKNLDCCRFFADPKYRPPTKSELKKLIELSGYARTDFAPALGGRVDHYAFKSLDRWVSEADYAKNRTIPYMEWRYLLVVLGVVDIEQETMKNIQAVYFEQ